MTCKFSIICEIIPQQKSVTREPQCFADRQMDNSVAYCVRTKFVHYMCMCPLDLDSEFVTMKFSRIPLEI